jgi:hypothetical protein
MICHHRWAILNLQPVGLGQPSLFMTVTPVGQLGDAICMGWTATKVISHHGSACLNLQCVDLGRPSPFVIVTPAGQLGDAICVGWTTTKVIPSLIGLPEFAVAGLGRPP